MKVYLVQHGEAVEKEVDPDRPLSAKGRKDVESVGKFLKKAGVCADRVWHSGKTCARQTAEILRSNLAPGGSLEQHSNLDPKDGPGLLAADVQRVDEDLIIVGHLPHLELLVARLLTGKEKMIPVAFARGGVVAMERMDDASWRITWIVIPWLLARS